jgi:cell division inhibitor SepF
MASFVDKMLAYLGLKDVEEDEFYDDYDEPEEHAHPAPRTIPTAYADHEPPDAGASGTVRPLNREESRADGATRAVVRPLVPTRSAKVHVVIPARFADAQEIGDLIKQSSPVIVNLQASERDLARRMIDFCSGLTYALGGSMEKVAEQVFLLTPSNVEVSAEERMRLQERGLFHS